MRLTVIGCGHLGATQAACLAEIGHEVLGVDVDEARIALLSSGRAWFHEPGLDELLTRKLRAGRLRFTTSFAEAAAFATVHLLSVSTPSLPDDDGHDLTQVFSAARALAAHVTRPSLIVGRSTVPPGTATQLALELSKLATAGRPGPALVEVAWNPEFLRTGSAISDSLMPDRIVVGVPSSAAETVIREVYRPLTRRGVPLVITDPVSAELAKAAANAFLATKLTLLNAISDLAAATGGDTAAIAEAVALDARIGPGFLTPGLGYGGGCLPKDVRGLAAFAAAAGVPGAQALLSAVDDVNTQRRQDIVDLAQAFAGPLHGKRIALWGAAFKAGTDDVRDSPSLDVADRLTRLGAEVVVYDPVAIGNAVASFPHLGFADSALAAAHEADAVLIGTAWPEFAAINPAAAAAAVRARLLIDGCQAIRPSLWRSAGWAVAAPAASR
ncbi:MAG TPA: nucleotide sugar dehydrogenase [Trebonia sp.]|jgi:UDPglucose 6-dehydrogenase|nr:nucleotide sugar dehydrogenase [Trebonia sp.]